MAEAFAKTTVPGRVDDQQPVRHRVVHRAKDGIGWPRLQFVRLHAAGYHRRRRTRSDSIGDGRGPRSSPRREPDRVRTLRRALHAPTRVPRDALTAPGRGRARLPARPSRRARAPRRRRSDRVRPHPQPPARRGHAPVAVPHARPALGPRRAGVHRPGRRQAGPGARLARVLPARPRARGRGDPARPVRPAAAPVAGCGAAAFAGRAGRGAYRHRRARRRGARPRRRGVRPQPRPYVAGERRLPPGGRRLARRRRVVPAPPARRRPRLERAVVAVGGRQRVRQALPRRPRRT